MVCALLNQGLSIAASYLPRGSCGCRRGNEWNFSDKEIATLDEAKVVRVPRLKLKEIFQLASLHGF